MGRTVIERLQGSDEQLPRGVKLIDLTPPRPMLTINAVWRQDHQLPTLERFFETAKQLALERHWS